MRQPRKHIAIKSLLFLALMWMGALAYAAQVAGTVVNLSGPLLARKADGTAKILSVKSEVEQGDTLVTEKNTYARIKFIDNSEITLRPGTTMTIDQFSFDAGKPDGDSAAFSLIKGGLRSITGLLGKRSKERFALKTPTATIGIRGTTFIVQYLPNVPNVQEAVALSRLDYRLASTAALQPSATPTRSDAAPAAAIVPLMLVQLKPTAPGGMAPGLYVHVIDGMINLSNRGGAQNFSAGQFGFTPSLTTPPVLVPSNPGIKFTPPPAFSSSGVAASASSASAKSGNVDCEVR